MKFKTIKYKNQKRKEKPKRCGPMDESQNALVIRSKGSGALCMSWSLLKNTPNQSFKTDLKKIGGAISLVEEKTCHRLQLPATRELQVFQSIKLEAQTSAIIFVSSRRFQW